MIVLIFAESIVDEATSKLSSVDFDKLKQSLVNLRKQNLKLTVIFFYIVDILYTIGAVHLSALASYA